MAKMDLRRTAQAFSLLADPTRLGILAVLSKGTSNVTGLCKALKLKQPTISHHLGLLRMGRLVDGVRKGKSVIYAASAQALKGLVAAVGKITP